MTRHPTVDTARTRLLGVELDCVTENEAVDWICGRAASGAGGFVVTANLDHLRRCRRDPAYARLVEQADLVVADGMPLIWASRLRGTPRLPERVAGSTLTVRICEAAAQRGVSVFLLGGAPGVAERAAARLVELNPGLRIAGVHCPPLGFESDEAMMSDVRSAVTAASPNLVLVALGSPKQERLISRIRDLRPSACWMGVGISLSFVAGDVRRAPLWMQKAGLEWLHRLAQEPRRLFARYVLHGIPWGCVLMMNAAADRFSKPRVTSLSHRP
jgi:N-acetylglucosaminyldiphosphoundecaprenol N-acetyl-beta-D-mannosaminyltransferase